MVPVDQKSGVYVLEYDDGVVLPSAQDWVSSKIVHPSYSDAEPLLHFLDKYTMIIIGGSKAMAEFKKLNKGKTLLDRVTVSDIAYSMLVYESSYDVWMEEMVKEEMCATREEKKAFKIVLGGWSRKKCARQGKRRRHSRVLPPTSTMFSVELDLLCTQMGGQVKAVITLMLFVTRFKI